MTLIAHLDDVHHALAQIAEMAQAHADEHLECKAAMRYILDRCGDTE